MPDLSPAERIHLAGVLTALSSQDPIERGHAARAVAELARHHEINWHELLAPVPNAPALQAKAGAAPWRPPPAPRVPPEHSEDLAVCQCNTAMLTPEERALATAIEAAAGITLEQRHTLATIAARVRAAGGWELGRIYGFRTPTPPPGDDVDPLTRYGYRRPGQ